MVATVEFWRLDGGFGATKHGADWLEIPSLNNAMIYYLGKYTDNAYTSVLFCVMYVVYVQPLLINGIDARQPEETAGFRPMQGPRL